MFPATPGKQQQKRSLPPPPAGFVLSRRLPLKMSQRKSARSAGDSYRSFVETIGNIVARYYLNSSLSRSLRQRPITFPRLPLRNFIIIPGSTLEFTGAIITGNMIRRAKSQSRSTCLRGLGHNPNSTRPVWSEESGARVTRTLGLLPPTAVPAIRKVWIAIVFIVYPSQLSVCICASKITANIRDISCLRCPYRTPFKHGEKSHPGTLAPPVHDAHSLPAVWHLGVLLHDILRVPHHFVHIELDILCFFQEESVIFRGLSILPCSFVRHSPVVLKDQLRKP